MTVTANYDGVEITHVLDEGGVLGVGDRLREGGRVCFDLETHTRSYTDKPGDRNVQGWHPDSLITVLALSWDGHSASVIPIAHPAAPWYPHWRETMTWLAEAMQGCQLIGHNLKFDVRFVAATTDVDLAGRQWWDTMLAAHVLDESQPTFRLKSLAAHLSPTGDWGEVDLTDTEEQQWTPLARYAGFDTAMTWRLFEEQYPQIAADDGLARVFRLISMRASRFLARAEGRGMMVDRARLKQAIADMTQEVTDATEFLDRTAQELGVDAEEIGGKHSYQPTAKFFREMMRRAIEAGMIDGLEKTPQGAWSWRKGVLNQQDTKLSDALMSYRHGDKRLQYLKVWDQEADHNDRLHSSTRIHGTRTGRMSSANPNLQQVARDLKSVYRAPEGFKFVEMDFSQVELRVAAWIGEIDAMKDAFNAGQDLHTLMAAIASDKDEAEVTKSERQRAKALNFGFIYGMGAEGFVTYARETYGVEVTLDEAEHLRHVFFTTWYGLEDWHRREEWYAYEHGEIRSPLGRRRLLPLAKHGKGYEQSKALRQAINTPVQATASDLMLMAMDRIDRLFEGDDRLHIVGTVHDSVLLEIAEDDVTTLVEQAAEVMMYPDLSRFGVSLDVPLAVDATIGTHWADEDAYELEFSP